MLTPRKVQELAEPMERIYAGMVDDLLVNIGKHIRDVNWTHTADYEIQKLSEIGQLTQENAAIINRWIKEIPATARATMENTRAAALDKLEKQLAEAAKDGAIPPPIGDTTVEVLQSLREQMGDKLNLVNSTTLQSSIDQYVRGVQITADQINRATEIVEGAAAKVTLGTESRNTAIRTALQRISDEGLTGFVDRAGRSWSPEAYVNTVVRSTVHNAAVQSTRARMQDYGTEVFQVSSHAGARPLCYPHQGKFYSWDNTSGEIILGDNSVVRYEGLDRTTYGQPAGLFGKLICRSKTSLTLLLRGVRTATASVGNDAECPC